MATGVTPPLPPGFVIDNGAPPLPDGFVPFPEGGPKVTEDTIYPPGMAAVGRGVGRGLTELARNTANNAVAGLHGDGPMTGPFGGLQMLMRQAPKVPGPGQESPQSAGEWRGYKAAHPYAAEGGRLLGRIGPQAAVSPQSYAGQILAGLVGSLGDENPGTSALTSMGLTSGLRGVAEYGGRAVNALKGKFSNTPVTDAVPNADLLRKAQAEGLQLDPYEASGKGGALLGSAEAHPLTRGVTAEFRAGQDEWLNGKVAGALGTKVTDFSDDGLRTIKGELSQKYDDIKDAVSKINGNAGVKLSQAYYDDLEKLLPAVTFARFKDELAYGDVSGPTFMKIRSAVSELTDNQLKGPDAVALVQELDNAFGKQVPKDLKAQYDTVREQWRNFFAVKSIRSESGRSAGGSISPVQLQTKLRGSYDVNLPHNPETKDLMDSVGALASRRAYQRSPGTSEKALTLFSNPVGYATSLMPALRGASMLGASPDQGAALLGNLGRLLSPEAIRQQTPYYLTPNGQ